MASDNLRVLNNTRADFIVSGQVARLHPKSDCRDWRSAEPQQWPPCFRNIVGRSNALRDVLDQVQLVGPSDATVLVHGETGTGKELIAQAIHELSRRKAGPIVKINCAAIPAALLESELFGHERGAFTGALVRRIGRFEAAHGGTLFLDEIGDMPVELQAKLLRVLQEREFERLGGTATVHADVRVVAATNQDLASLVGEKRFRLDLFYRLNVFPMTLPPLRERGGDVPLLVEYFVRTFAEKHGKSIETIPDRVMDALQRHDWPGNIRELQNVIERGVIITAGSVLSSDTTTQLRNPVGSCAKCAPVNTLADAERAHIMKTLRETNWVVGGRRGAAIRLGLARTTLLARMSRLGISTRAPRESGRELDRPSLSGFGTEPKGTARPVNHDVCVT